MNHKFIQLRRLAGVKRKFTVGGTECPLTELATTLPRRMTRTSPNVGEELATTHSQSTIAGNISGNNHDNDAPYRRLCRYDTAVVNTNTANNTRQGTANAFLTEFDRHMFGDNAITYELVHELTNLPHLEMKM